MNRPTHTHTNTALTLPQQRVFTFLQAVMEEAMVLSVLPPSASVASEPSNMADDWKLLQGNKKKSWVCQNRSSSSTSVLHRAL